jgi:hypothetical protein
MRREYLGDMAKEVFDYLPESVELIYLDYRDQLDPSVYEEVLRAGWKGRDVAQDYADETWPVDYLWDVATDVVLEVAASRGYMLRSPTSGMDPDDFHELVVEVMERDLSDSWNSLIDLASKDEVLLGVSLSDEWFDYGAKGIAEAFGLGDKTDAWWSEDWERAVSGQGNGQPTLIVAVSGADILEFARDVYVSGLGNNEEATVMMRGYDAGLLNAFEGSGWIEPVASSFGVVKSMKYSEFMKSVWIDNRPGARGTWTEIVGRASASRPGELRLVES